MTGAIKIAFGQPRRGAQRSGARRRGIPDPPRSAALALRVAVTLRQPHRLVAVEMVEHHLGVVANVRRLDQAPAELPTVFPGQFLREREAFLAALVARLALLHGG